MANRGSPSRRAERVKRAKQRERLRRIRVASLSALVVVIVAVAIMVFTGGGDDEGDGNADGTIDVDMFEFGFDGNLTAPAGEVRVSAKNDGRLNHNIGIRRGPISPEVRPGGRISFELGELAPGTYELYCDIIGHADKGMVAPLVITEPEPAPSG